jgi:hypothetical protein
MYHGDKEDICYDSKYNFGSINSFFKMNNISLSLWKWVQMEKLCLRYGQSGFNLHVHSGQKPVLQKLVIVFSLHNMQPGLTLEGNSGEEVTLWRLTSLSRLSKAKFKSPCNVEESPYVAACIFSPLVIYEIVDIVHVFIEIYPIHY